MKKFFLLLTFALFSLAGYSQHYYLKFKDIQDLQAFMQWTTRRMPLVSCHRGGPMPGFPENAIETFANSTRFQPSVIECDASLSKDSVLVMMHDDRLERTSNGTGEVSSKTLSQLKTLRLKDDQGKLTPYRIPTLDEVLQWGKGKVLFTLDVKRGVPYEMMIKAVRRNKAEANSIIITYSANQAAEVHRLAPDLMISASVKGPADLERLNKMGVPNNRIVAFVGTSAPDQSVCQYLHSKGIWCILGTMGNLDNRAKSRGDKIYSELVDGGADILSTDRASECGKELMKYVRERKLDAGHLVISPR